MASPIDLYVAPNCGLQIELIDDPNSLPAGRIFKNKTKRDEPRKYRVINVDSIPKLDITNVSDHDREGWMSPIYDVTLKSKIKSFVGIPRTATKFAYLYPPNALAQYVDWTSGQFEEIKIKEPFTEEQLQSKYSEIPWGMSFITILGGFVYFDSEYKIVCVNALSLWPTPYPFNLSGPYETNKTAIEEMRALNRIHGVRPTVLFETKCYALCWIHPNEKFRKESAVANGEPYAHGAFVFTMEDGSSVAYILKPGGFVDSSGDTSSIADAFHSMKKNIKQAGGRNLDFVSSFHIYNHEEYTSLVKVFDSFNSRSTIKELEQKLDATNKYVKQYYFHKLCQLGSLSSVKEILNKTDKEGTVKQILLSKDKLDRTPLHVACQYRSSVEDFELIKLLVQKQPEAVLMKDCCDRYPIHQVLQNPNCCVEIIDLLLAFDVNYETIYQPTKIMGNLLLHIACYSRVLDEKVYKTLLDIDFDAKYLSEITRSGADAIYIAIEKRLPSQILQLLLQKDAEQGHKSIYRINNGISVLHLACWNNSDPKVIELLLQYDTLKNLPQIGILQGENEITMENQLSCSGSTLTNVEEDAKPLHIALLHCNEQVIRLLMNESNNDIIWTKDRSGRLPIHLASMNSTNPSVIEILLASEKGSHTSVLVQDNNGYTPLHYACNKSDANPTLIKLLLKADDKCRSETTMKRPSHTLGNDKRSPLFLALISDVSDSVLDLLLQPEHFFLRGIESLQTELGNRISKSRSLQDRVVDRLAERCYYGLLFLDMYMHLVGIISFLCASEKLLNGISLSWESWETYAIVIVISVNALRELIRLSSQGLSYVWDPWTWSELAGTALLIASFSHIQAVSNGAEINRLLLSVTGALLIIQAAFFLRTTFLPFAKFVGGLLMIMGTLIPFFIVSSCILLGFAYAYFMKGTREDCTTLFLCYKSVFQNFFFGSDATQDFIDILFGIILIVVLLNVLIAIINEVWSDATDSANDKFWSFRCDYLIESRFFSYVHKKAFYFLKGFEDFIDTIEGDSLLDEVDWTCYPYNLIQSREMYLNPEYFLSSELADEIKNSKSLQSDLYWMKHQYEDDKKRHHHYKTSRKRHSKEHVVAIQERFDDHFDLSNYQEPIPRYPKSIYYTACAKLLLQFVGRCLLYLFLIIIGLISFGWTWPKNLRVKTLSVGLKEKEKESKL